MWLLTLNFDRDLPAAFWKNKPGLHLIAATPVQVSKHQLGPWESQIGAFHEISWKPVKGVCPPPPHCCVKCNFYFFLLILVNCYKDVLRQMQTLFYSFELSLASFQVIIQHSKVQTKFLWVVLTTTDKFQTFH